MQHDKTSYLLFRKGYSAINLAISQCSAFNAQTIVASLRSFLQLPFGQIIVPYARRYPWIGFIDFGHLSRFLSFPLSLAQTSNLNLPRIAWFGPRPLYLALTWAPSGSKLGLKLPLGSSQFTKQSPKISLSSLFGNVEFWTQVGRGWNKKRGEEKYWNVPIPLTYA